MTEIGKRLQEFPDFWEKVLNAVPSLRGGEPFLIESPGPMWPRTPRLLLPRGKSRQKHDQNEVAAAGIVFPWIWAVQQSLSKSLRDAARLDRIQLYQTHCHGISLTSIRERSAVAYQELPTKKFFSSSSGKCE